MKTNRDNLAGGMILILLGLMFLVFQFFPTLFGDVLEWPWVIIGIGVIFLALSVALRVGGFAIPGFIVTGIGAMLMVQEATGNWESWAWSWSLIPGFAGLGILFGGLFDDDLRDARSGAWILLALSAGFLVIFGSAFQFGWEYARFWPVILILLGAWVLLQQWREA